MEGTFGTSTTLEDESLVVLVAAKKRTGVQGRVEMSAKRMQTPHGHSSGTVVLWLTVTTIR
jgi:hypothetical protein